MTDMTHQQSFFFLKKIVLFIFLLCVADQLLGLVLDYYYKRQKSGMLAHASYAMETGRSEL